MTAQPLEVADVECSDCGRQVTPPEGVTADHWRCYACGWGSMPELNTEKH